MAKVCIIGKEEVKTGYPVKEDIVIKAIRIIKKKFNIATGNELMVCEEHLEEAKKRRKDFESSIIKLVALISVVAVIAIVLAILRGTFDLIPSTFVLLLLLGLLMAVLSLFKYYPAIDLERKISKISSKGQQKKVKGKK